MVQLAEIVRRTVTRIPSHVLNQSLQTVTNREGPLNVVKWGFAKHDYSRVTELWLIEQSGRTIYLEWVDSFRSFRYHL